MSSDASESPADLSKPSLWAVVKRARVEFGNDSATDLAAALTYYAVLAVVPGLIVLLSILGLTHASTTQLTTQAARLAPGSTGKVIEFSSDKLKALRDEICREHGWDPVSHQFQIFPANQPIPAKERKKAPAHKAPNNPRY